MNNHTATQSLFGLTVLSIVLFTGCGGGDNDSSSDSDSTDTSPDTAIDTGEDTSVDTVADTGADTSVDTSADTASDTWPIPEGTSAIIEFIPDTEATPPYALGENDYGMTGSAFIARSPLGNDTLEILEEPGKVCLKGTVEKVPTPADGSHPPYGDYWGIQVGFNLNAGDAWMPGDVLGFSFVLEGPDIANIRVKSLPFGLAPELESSDKCKTLFPKSGEPQMVLFTDLTQYCWDPGNPVIDTSAGLVNIAIQVAASTAMASPVDWCLKDLRVILAAP